jgi:ferredoxin-NADP reductase
MSARLIMKLEVTDLVHEAGDVAVVSLKHPRRPALPAATAGAHVDVHVPGLGVRQYSLCGDPADRSRYRIAVKREPEGRGGSRWLHENLTVGAMLNVSAPRNHFELDAAERYLLLAGGIGITPMLAMAHALRADGRPFVLHAFARSRSAVPLLAALEDAAGSDRLALHLSDEPQTRIALVDILARPEPGTLVYCCGSQRFMDGVREAAADWPEDSLRFEAFTALTDPDFVPEPFAIAVPSRDATLPVPAGRSALEVLRELGIELPSSCEIGVCGSCECGVLEGRPIHRDVVLSPRARRTRFIPCVSRAEGTLVLDL